ncbi:MAG: hypothetical protein QXT19_01535 [Candidatus Woesearchaeota archaeon]
MPNFKIDSEFALALLGIFAVILIVTIILFISRQLGIQTYSVLKVGTPCHKIYCGNERLPAKEIGRDWERGIVYCQCRDGPIRQERLFS